MPYAIKHPSGNASSPMFLPKFRNSWPPVLCCWVINPMNAGFLQTSQLLFLGDSKHTVM
jgi:hypothetical protein